MSIELEIWGTEASQPRVESVRDRISIVQPVPETFYNRCAHGISGDRCDVCRAIRERDAAKAALAAVQPAEMQSKPSFGPAAALVPAVVPAPEAEPEPVPEVVRLAQDYEQAVRKLQQDKQLLVVAEARVEMLTQSIQESTAAVEDARSKLAAFVAK